MDSFDNMMVALRFNEKINQRDLDGLVQLMTDDHTFIDKLGEIHKGKDVMQKGWRSFFNDYPDYRNILVRTQVEDDFVIMMGHSKCSHKQLDGAALWSARVHDGRISEWRVYEDTPQNRRQLGLTN